jgi:CHAT domain-containing protein
MTDQISALRRRLDPQDQALLDELAKVRTQRATLALKEPDPADLPQHRAEVTRLETEVERLEAQISARSAEFRAQSQPVTLEGVQQAIPDGTALVEFTTYLPYNAKASGRREEAYGAARYAVYVLGRRGGAPAFVDLGETSTIDRGVTQLRAALSDPRRTDTAQLARALDELVMLPVRKLLGETQKLLLSPDGALNLIPFSALVDERGKYLVERYEITYLTSGRDLLRLGTQTKSRQGPMVIANPAFDLRLATGAQPAPTTNAAGSKRSVDLSQARFGPLKGTASEAIALKNLLVDARVLTQEQATEAALKKVAGPRILHIATHGFFLPDQPQETIAQTRGLSLGGGPQKVKGENPLLRSGLAFAGANQLQDGAGEDGVLTALEAAGLDLWGTKLVVLSACETGVGDVKSGDGVYGLRRALILAGAESELMSLWQVSDAATRDLMVEYYKLLQAGEGRTSALRRVQLAMLKSEVQSQQSPGSGQNEGAGKNGEDRRHPFFWASFIPIGDWRSLE